MLTNINCSSNCIFQKDGKFTLEAININYIAPFNDCAYFVSLDSEV